jgi:hypothetical protein
MVETAIFDTTLATSIALRMAVITFGLVQPARFARCWLAIAPAAAGVPVNL